MLYGQYVPRHLVFCFFKSTRTKSSALVYLETPYPIFFVSFFFFTKERRGDIVRRELSSSILFFSVSLPFSRLIALSFHRPEIVRWLSPPFQKRKVYSSFSLSLSIPYFCRDASPRIHPSNLPRWIPAVARSDTRKKRVTRGGGAGRGGVFQSRVRAATRGSRRKNFIKRRDGAFTAPRKRRARARARPLYNSRRVAASSAAGKNKGAMQEWILTLEWV